VSGSSEVAELLTNGTRQWVEAAFTVEKDVSWTVSGAATERCCASVWEKRTEERWGDFHTVRSVRPGISQSV
ncbi:MAG TPA: hypothetical protein H9723_06700, partial [Candidatus Mediterraneibacter stercoravium]|nr:hypothetical protein [Candidatus Mediterraneibacter stercoravium]